MEETHQLEEAIKCFTEAARLAPNDQDALVNRGNCYMQIGDIQNAINSYEEVLRADESSVIAWYNLGSAHHARKDIDRATYHFTRTIALDPSYADAHFNLGIVSWRMPPTETCEPVNASQPRCPLPPAAHLGTRCSASTCHG